MAKRQSQKQAARERAAALRAQQEAAERRTRLLVVAVTLGVVAIMVVGLVVAALNRPKAQEATSTPSSGALSAAAQKTLTSVPASTFDAVGVGPTDNLPKKTTGADLISTDGKPQILYVGAEYCPYCAGLRWSTAVAMSRFGTWDPLTTTHSAPAPEVYPDTATLSFAQAAKTKLTSDVVDFVSYETATNVFRNGQYGPLDEVAKRDEETFTRFDVAPYTTSPGAIPFISFGGKAIQAGAVYDTGVLEGKTAEQIAAALANPDDPITKAVVGGANAITAATCEATAGKPADVCTSAGVKAAAAKLQTAR